MMHESWFVVRGSWFIRFLVVLLTGLLVGYADSRTTNADPRGIDKVGVLVLAHGGSNRWNSMVRKAVREADLGAPIEVTLGMGMHEHEVRALQQAVNRLERRGASRLVVVPLFVSSHSEVFRQLEYLFGLREEAQWPEAGKPLALEVPVVMGKALDDSQAVAEVLLERANALSRTPEKEAVILVAHGPNGDADDALWIESMKRLAEFVKQKGHFREVLSLTLRDDAPKPIHKQATKHLRETVQRSSHQGRVLVVPLLIAQGGVERKIPKILAGLSYVYKGETLLPHPKLVRWIAEQATGLARASLPAPPPDPVVGGPAAPPVEVSDVVEAGESQREAQQAQALPSWGGSVAQDPSSMVK